MNGTEEQVDVCRNALDELAEGVNHIGFAVDMMHTFEERTGLTNTPWVSAEQGLARIAHCFAGMWGLYKAVRAGEIAEEWREQEWSDAGEGRSK